MKSEDICQELGFSFMWVSGIGLRLSGLATNYLPTKPAYWIVCVHMCVSLFLLCWGLNPRFTQPWARALPKRHSLSFLFLLNLVETLTNFFSLYLLIFLTLQNSFLRTWCIRTYICFKRQIEKSYLNSQQSLAHSKHSVIACLTNGQCLEFSIKKLLRHYGLNT